ncbi:hypothetical protein Cgig2_008724 [Carnegiea gigantea]|uniref:Uncharacterized protein n=1 Tax=Carnegiea gigantea TaxID=171969 RepID=A0A9Q1QGD5_9CARY|nr:hypothetical protein Cgig2_008724 [Carnegiea gigantea]
MISSLQITSSNCFYISSLHRSTPNSPKPKTGSSKASLTSFQPTPNSPMSCRPRIESHTSEAKRASPKEPTPQASPTISCRPGIRSHISKPNRVSPKESTLQANPSSSSRPRPRLQTSSPKAKEPEPHVDEFVECVREVQDERRNNERDKMSDDDNEDADFNEAEQVPVDEYDDTSLDEESFNSYEGLDNIEFELDTKSRMHFGREITHDEGNRNLIVNKMSRVFNKCVLWSRNKAGSGIISALNKIMPIAKRRVCVIHLYKNFASSYPVAWFYAYFYIAANAYSTYARFKFDHTLKYPDNTNNSVESFNHTILNFRGKTILKMLDIIRKLVGGRFVKRFETAQSWEGKVVPHVEKKFKFIERESRNYSNIIHARRREFDVTKGKTNFIIGWVIDYVTIKGGRLVRYLANVLQGAF